MLTKLALEKYKVQSTGADGGHSYIITEIEHNRKTRKLVVLFSNKSDEQNLKENIKIQIKGYLVDEGEEYDLIISNATIEK